MRVRYCAELLLLLQLPPLPLAALPTMLLLRKRAIQHAPVECPSVFGRNVQR
jgi:hypothetical protein